MANTGLKNLLRAAKKRKKYKIQSNLETIYDLPSKAYDKSKDCDLVLNTDKFLSCTRAAGK